MVFTGRPTAQYPTVPQNGRFQVVPRAWDSGTGGYGSSHGANSGGPTMPNMYARPSIAEQLAQRNMYARPSIAEQLAQRNYLEVYENTRQRPRYPRSPLSILFGIGY